jgi:hypothetical protein
MARWCDGFQIIMSARQNRAILGPAQGQGNWGGVFDLDNRRAGLKAFVAVWGKVFFGIVGVQLFDVNVLIVQIGLGKAPAQALTPSG